MDLKPASIIREPTPDIRVLVIRSIILNIKYGGGVVFFGNMPKKIEVSRGIKDIMSLVIEPLGKKINATEHFDGLPFTGDGNFWLTASASPGSVQGGVLAERYLVFEDQCRVL